MTFLSFAQVRVLYADRGFIGQDRFAGLVKRGIPFCVHLRLDMMMDNWQADDGLAQLRTEPGAL